MTKNGFEKIPGDVPEGEVGSQEVQDEDASEALAKISALAHKSSHLRDQIMQLTDSQFQEREDLIGRAKRTYKSVEEAKGQIDLLQKIFEADKTNTVFGENLEKATQIFEELKKKVEIIDKRIAIIEKNPKVMERVIGDAKLEDQEREAKKIEAEFMERATPEAEALGEEIINLSSRIHDSFADKTRSQNELDGLVGKIGDKIRKIQIHTEKDRDLFNEINESIRTVKNIDDFVKMLQERRSELGMFDKSKKRMIDSILEISDVGMVRTNIEMIRDKEAEHEVNKTKYNSVKKEEDEIKKKYRSLIEEAWAAEDKIKTLLGEKRPELPSGVHSIISKKIDKAADIKRWENGKEVGRFGQWYDATTSNPKIGTLSDVWRRTEVGVDIYSRSKKEGGDS